MLTESSFSPGLHHMKNPLKIMTAIIQKIRRKRKLSSEFDSRWGDMAISSPNDGSWSQYDRASTRASPVSARSSDHDHGHGHGWKQGSVESSEPYTPVITGNLDSRKASADSSITMPTGYYDARVRSRSQKKHRSPAPQPVQGGYATLPKAWEEEKFGDSSADEAETDIVSALGSQRGKPGTDDTYSRGSKSPPLSVTSRMRRFSGQSTVMDPVFSMPGTASSKRTSFSSDDPQLARHTPQQDKRPPQRTKLRDPRPISPKQEMVPSYEDLYG